MSASGIPPLAPSPSPAAAPDPAPTSGDATARLLPGAPHVGAGFDRPFDMLDACHDRVRRSLDLLARLLDHLQRQGRDEAARSAAGDVWRYFELAAPQHHQDEERHVLPWAQASGDAALADAAAQVLADHQAFHTLWQATLGPQLLALRDGAPDAFDLPTLRAAAQAFIDRHQNHLLLEDGLLFPARRAALRAAEACGPGDQEAEAAIGQEMAARRGVRLPPR